MKKLLILTSARTGGGHVSLTEALCEQFDEMPGLEYRVADGFDLMSRARRRLLADSYGFVTRRAGLLWLWRFGYRVVEKRPGISVCIFKRACRKRLLALADAFGPDAILAVNPCFVGSALDILEKAGRAVPLFCLQADLANIAATWFDPRTALNVALTEEAYAYSVQKGVAPERLLMGGFPVRRRFFSREDGAPQRDENGWPREILLMGGAEGAGGFVRAARVLLSQTQSRVTIVCGRNRKLLKKLIRLLSPEYGARASLCGFISDMDKRMAAADLIVMRGSPNSAMEAAALCKPLIVIDSLPGQEKDNPRVLTEHGLCRYVPDVDKLPDAIRALFAEDGAALEEMRRAQETYLSPACARRIARAIVAKMGEA